MKNGRGDFVRRLGKLRIGMRHLDQALREGSPTEIEARSTLIEDLLLELTKCQHKLSRADQLDLQPQLTAARQQALSLLEIARRILDDSLDAALTLIQSVQPDPGYGPRESGPSLFIDRRA